MSYRWLPMLLAALLLPASVAAQVPPPAPAPAAPKLPPKSMEPDLGRLVQQLGDKEFLKREAAFRELQRIGPVALAILRQALASNNDEIRRRAQELVPMLERRVESELALTPTKVTLAYKDLPLSEVIKDLNDRTKYNFLIAEKDKGLADRRVTLATGELPFWEAMDQLSRQARINVDLAGPNEVWEAGQKENPPAKGRQRVPYQPARYTGEPGFIISEAKTPPIDTCHCGSVRFALCPAAAEKTQAERKPPATDSSRNKFDTPPARPGAPGNMPPANANGPGAPGGMGGGGGGAPPQQEALPSRDQRKKAIKDKEEDNRPVHTVLLEIQTEPRLQWRGPLQLRTEPLFDEKKQEVDNVGANAANPKNDPANRPMRVMGVGPGGQQVLVQGETFVPNDPNSRNGKHEIALHCRLPEKPGKVLPVLRGCLVGQVEVPMAIEVPDVTKAANEVFKGKDGHELQVAECTFTAPGQHRVVVELSVPGGANAWAQGGQLQMNRAAPAGGRRGNAASQDFSFTDAKGRAVKVMGRTETLVVGNRGLANRVSFFLRGDDADAVPRKLVYSTTRLVTIEAPFEFKNVPLR